MATIKKVEEIKKMWEGKEKKSYKFYLDDGKEGFASNKSPWEFKEGEQVSYTTETKNSSKGAYNVFTFTRISGSAPAPQQSIGASLPVKPAHPIGKTSGMTAEDWKARACIDAYGFMVEAIRDDKLDWPQIEEKYKMARDLLWKDIDEVFGTK